RSGASREGIGRQPTQPPSSAAARRLALLTPGRRTPGPGKGQRAAASFDDLVGASEQRWRHGEAEPSGSPHIDGDLEFRRLLDRKLRWSATPEDLVHK